MREAVAALDTEIDAQTWYEIWTAGNGTRVPRVIRNSATGTGS